MYKSIIFLLFLSSVYSRQIKQNVLRLTRVLGSCEGKSNLAMRLYNISIQNLDRQVVVDCDIIVEHDLVHEVSPILTLERCKNKDALDTCQTFQNLRFPKSCDLIVAKGQFWTPFMNAIHPRIVCPVKKGTYIVKNATFDASNIIIPVTGWFWKSTMNTYDVKTKENLMCLYLEGEVIEKSLKG